MTFLKPTDDFRWILPTETDSESPLSEELMSQYRENVETSVLGTIGTGKRAIITDNGTGSDVLTLVKSSPADPNWIAGELIGLVLTITSGLGIGLAYTITANTALVGTGSSLITVAGADFESDGILIGDTILITFVITDHGHTHNGIDSMPLNVRTMFSSQVSGITTNIDGAYSTIHTVYYIYTQGTSVLAYNFQGRATITRSINAVLRLPSQTAWKKDGTTTTIANSHYSPALTANPVNRRHNAYSEFEFGLVCSDVSTGGMLPDYMYRLEIHARFVDNVSATYVTSDTQMWEH